MLYWTLVFLVVALVAGALGFGGIAGASSGIAQILFFLFLALVLISFISELLRRVRSSPNPYLVVCQGARSRAVGCGTAKRKPALRRLELEGLRGDRCLLLLSVRPPWGGVRRGRRPALRTLGTARLQEGSSDCRIIFQGNFNRNLAARRPFRSAFILRQTRA